MTNEELKEIRETHNLTKGEFAKLLNVTPMVYGRYESGSLEIPEELEEKIKKASFDGTGAAVATEIEVKKKIRGAARKVKETAEDTINASMTSDEAVATVIDVKKKTRDVVIRVIIL